MLRPSSYPEPVLANSLPNTKFIKMRTPEVHILCRKSQRTIRMNAHGTTPQKNPRRSSDRPPMAARSTTNARAPPSRNASYAPPSDDRPSPRQKLSRAETERMPPINTNSSPRGNGSALFGEFSMGDSPKSYHGSPKAYDDRPIRPSPSRRASEDIRERDVYPGSHHKSHGRPNYRGAPVH